MVGTCFFFSGTMTCARSHNIFERRFNLTPTSPFQCISSSRELGKDAVPQPSRLCVTCAPHLFHLPLSLLPQNSVPYSPGLPAVWREARERTRHQRAVHAAFHCVPVLSGWAAQSGALSTGQAAVVHSLTFPSGPETLPVTFTCSQIRRSAFIVCIATGDEAPKRDKDSL